MFVYGGRRVSSVPLNYYMTGHVPTTSAHAAAHKAHIFHMKLIFPVEYMDLNAGGAEVPLSCNNIRWNTQNLLYATNTKNIIYMQNKYYNWKLWCGESDLDGRKFNDILFGLMFVKQ